MIVSVNYFNFGIDIESDEVFLVICHCWGDDVFFGIDIECMLMCEVFDDIVSVYCL